MDFTKEQIIENRKKWLEALKSGKYPKGEGISMCQGGKYSCFGVAAKVVGCGEFDTIFGYKVFDGYASITPDRVFLGLGLYSSTGFPRKNGPSLADINDHSGTFAPVIEALETGQYWIPEGEL